MFNQYRPTADYPYWPTRRQTMSTEEEFQLCCACLCTFIIMIGVGLAWMGIMWLWGPDIGFMKNFGYACVMGGICGAAYTGTAVKSFLKSSDEITPSNGDKANTAETLPLLHITVSTPESHVMVLSKGHPPTRDADTNNTKQFSSTSRITL